MKKLLPAILACATGLAAQDLTGTWQGTLQAGGRELRTVVKIGKADVGAFKGTFYSIDQGGQPLPTGPITLQAGAIKMPIPSIGGTFEGRLAPGGESIAGMFTQGGPAIPLNLKIATPETAWAIPEPPAPQKPMRADANLVFEVATIKPTSPDTRGRGFRVQGRRFSTINTSVMDLITFAYGMHAKQVTAGPAWLEADHYDISAQPGAEGQPNDRQLRTMVQKLLAERFKLTFHRDRKELSVYAIALGKAGPKLTKSGGDPDGLPSLGFRGMGHLAARNTTIADFADLMQSSVLDRPVLDQSSIAGRYDFTLDWTPDETQFASMAVPVPKPTDDPSAPPDLFAAVRQQLGLKFEATRAQADILVLDKVEKPSGN